MKKMISMNYRMTLYLGKKMMLKKYFLAFLSFLILNTLFVAAQDLPERPNTLVTDYTNTLSQEEQQLLERKLENFNDSTSTQIAIVIMSSLNGYPINDYAVQLYNKWGIGQKGKDNGTLILISKDERKMFISTGYGLEGSIPDAIAKRIVEKEMKPRFREGDFYGGLNKATDVMIALTKGEYKADQYANEEEPTRHSFIFYLIIAIVFIVFYSKYRSVRSYSAMNHIPFWTAWMLMNAASRRHRGRWDDFSSGSGIFGGWGGGSSGGGFGGFGGGSSGGGGAGGSW